MKLLIVVDSCLSPEWADFLVASGFAAIHWRDIGAVHESDENIALWAKANGHALFSNDLDFSKWLALNRASSPSVLQIRTKLLLPEFAGELLLRAIVENASALESGSLVTLDETTMRTRSLPF